MQLLLWVKLLKPRSLVALSVALLITLTLNSMAFNLAYGFTGTLTKALGGGTEKMILSQNGSKTVYTGRIPLSLAMSLNMMEGVEAWPSTLIPTTLKGMPIVFRGVASTREYEGNITEGEIPRQEGPWFMVGKRTFEELNLTVGQIVPVCSPRNPKVLLLKLVAVYKTGSLKDWEAVLPLEYGRILTNLPKGTISIIEVEGLDEKELGELVTESYELTLNYDVEGGNIHVLDLIGFTYANIKIDASGTKSLLLPFGYYRLVYNDAYQTSNLASLLLTHNTSINLGVTRDARFQLKVQTSGNESPVLRLQNGTVVEGTFKEDSWIYKVPQGLHELEVEGTHHYIQVLEDTIFNPLPMGDELHQVTLKVYSQEGYVLSGYVATVINEEGETMFSTSNRNPSVNLFLPPGVYKVEVLKPPHTASTTLEVPGETEISLKLPTLLKPSRVPLTLYREVEAYTQIERSDATLSLIIGLSTVVLITSTMTMFALSMIAVVIVQNGIYNASKENIHLLTQLGAGKLEILRMIGVPTFITSLSIGFLAGWISLKLHPPFLKPVTFLAGWIYVKMRLLILKYLTLLAGWISLNLHPSISKPLTMFTDLISTNLHPPKLKPLTILGYGITVNPTLTLVFSAALGAASWTYSNMRLHNWVAD